MKNKMKVRNAMKNKLWGELNVSGKSLRINKVLMENCRMNLSECLIKYHKYQDNLKFKDESILEEVRDMLISYGNRLEKFEILN